MDLHSFPGCSSYSSEYATRNQQGQVDAELSFEQENIFLDAETLFKIYTPLVKEVLRFFDSCHLVTFSFEAMFAMLGNSKADCVVLVQHG